MESKVCDGFICDCRKSSKSLFKRMEDFVTIENFVTKKKLSKEWNKMDIMFGTLIPCVETNL